VNHPASYQIRIHGQLPRAGPAAGSSQGRRESSGRVTSPHPAGQQAEDN